MPHFTVQDIQEKLIPLPIECRLGFEFQTLKLFCSEIFVLLKKIKQDIVECAVTQTFSCTLHNSKELKVLPHA